MYKSSPQMSTIRPIKYLFSKSPKATNFDCLNILANDLRKSVLVACVVSFDLATLRLVELKRSTIPNRQMRPSEHTRFRNITNFLQTFLFFIIIQYSLNISVQIQNLLLYIFQQIYHNILYI